MSISHQASGGFGLECVCCLHFGLSFAMAIHSLKSLEMPLLASAFSSALPHVICGQPTGRECATPLANNCRGARLMGIRATWPAQRRSSRSRSRSRSKSMSSIRRRCDHGGVGYDMAMVLWGVRLYFPRNADVNLVLFLSYKYIWFYCPSSLV